MKFQIWARLINGLCAAESAGVVKTDEEFSEAETSIN